MNTAPLRTVQVTWLLLFVLGSSYAVLHYEYKEGNFLYWFFRADVWYAVHNKVIFPVYFWGCVAVYLFVRNAINRCETREIFGFLKDAFVYHLYLLLLSHSEEITPGFTLYPVNIAPPWQITSYEQVFMQAAFVAYYIFSIRFFFKLFGEGAELRQLIFPASLLVPYLYLASPSAHIAYLVFALGAYFIRHTFGRFVSLSEKVFTSLRSVVWLVFLVGLFFRLWYAAFFSSAETDMTGFSADGPQYYRSALAFAKGDFAEVNFWHAPFYALYLSGFFALFGHSPVVLFYGQAVVGAFAPVIVLKIVERLGFRSAAVIAGLLVATSHLCIHYSVVINRAAPVLVTLPLCIYLCLDLLEFKRVSKVFALGVFMGMTFYFGQELIVVLSVVTTYLCIKLRDRTRARISSEIAWVVLGFLIVIVPLNWIHYKSHGRWIPLGRDPKAFESLSPFEGPLTEMGFNPVKELGASIAILLKQPEEAIPLIVEKLRSGVPGFLFDLDGVYFLPWHLSLETFYGAHIQFYTYWFVGMGLFCFLFNGKIGLREKILIFSPVVLQMIFTSVVIFGTSRFRVPVVPLNMVFAAFALERLCWGQGRGSDGFVFRIPPIQNTGFWADRWKWTIAALGFVLWVMATDFLLRKSKSRPLHPHYASTHWITIKQGRRVAINNIGIDKIIFSSYHRSDGSGGSSAKLVFDLCSFLLPGGKPYYRVMVDGQFAGPPRKIQGGCSEIRQEIHPKYDRGLIGFTLYFSPDGQIGEPRPVQITLLDRQSKAATLLVPIPPFPSEDKAVTEQVRLFNKYSNGSVKVTQPYFLSADSPAILPGIS